MDPANYKNGEFTSQSFGLEFRLRFSVRFRFYLIFFFWCWGLRSKSFAWKGMNYSGRIWTGRGSKRIHFPVIGYLLQVWISFFARRNEVYRKNILFFFNLIDFRKVLTFALNCTFMSNVFRRWRIFSPAILISEWISSASKKNWIGLEMSELPTLSEKPVV